jgi:hypothetical protein
VAEWSDQRKLAHAEEMALKLIDRYPLIADMWLTSADLIRNRMIANKDTHNHESHPEL